LFVVVVAYEHASGKKSNKINVALEIELDYVDNAHQEVHAYCMF
jgi:hypothetical protein